MKAPVDAGPSSGDDSGIGGTLLRCAAVSTLGDDWRMKTTLVSHLSFILTPPTSTCDRLDSLVRHWRYNRKDYTSNNCEIANFTIFTDDTINKNSLYVQISSTVLVDLAR